MATIAAHAAQTERAIRQPLTLATVVVVGTAAAAATALDAGGSPAFDPDALSVVRGFVVASYLLVGAYTRWHRPASRFGDLLIAVSLIYAGAALAASEDSLTHTVGRATLAALIVLLVYVFLCFPNDSLASTLERRLAGGFATATMLLWIPTLALAEQLPPSGPLTDCADDCPANAFRLATVPDGVSSAIENAVGAATALGLLGMVLLLGSKIRAPGRLRRRMVVPLLASAVALALNFVGYTLARQAGLDDLGALVVLGALAALAIPLAILVGQVRGRVFAATSLGQLVARVGTGPVTPERVEILLRDALGDPQLTLVLRDGAGGFFDVRGREVTLPIRRRDAHATPVMRNGRMVAALLHDPALDDDSGIAEGLAATSLLLLENAQLVDELEASRARIVASAQRERLQLERNLHDGAQQRLFALQLKVKAARLHADGGPLAQELDEIAGDAAAAAEELRALAHGLYPTALREQGLGGGLRSVARAAAIPVRIEDRGVGRCSETVEEAVYYAVVEAIQNAGKHAGDGAHVSVTLERHGTTLEFAVSDDGTGFDLADALAGMGLASIRDRIGAIGGEVTFLSLPGRGTTVTGLVPGCAPA